MKHSCLTTRFECQQKQCLKKNILGQRGNYEPKGKKTPTHERPKRFRGHGRQHAKQSRESIYAKCQKGKKAKRMPVYFLLSPQQRQARPTKQPSVHHTNSGTLTTELQMCTKAKIEKPAWYVTKPACGKRQSWFHINEKRSTSGQPKDSQMR